MFILVMFKLIKILHLINSNNKAGIKMLTKHDKQILSRLQDNYPEAYDLFMRREAEHRELLKTGCHDIRNIVTLLSGSYQLLGLTTPQLNSIPRFVKMGDDIKALIKAFNDIALYRYAGTITPVSTDLSTLESSIRQFITDEHYDVADYIRLICNNPDATINTDIQRLANAAHCLISNAIEACDYSSDAAVPITVNLSLGSDNRLIIKVTNIGSAPDSEISDKMFNPFCTDKSEHLGLGLAIAAETADALDGTISYSHDLGITSFILDVPAVIRT